jgi:cyclopropane fatty-acyl-phospholipid synthase-like methyltransferase
MVLPIKEVKMGYFDDEKNVEAYIKMAEGFDGRGLINILKKYLENGSTVLELGMGPGKDLEILSEFFQVTGSDNSELFLERYRKKDATADLVLLDAVTMEIARNFDCIYSNKVLHHLTKEELKKSLKRQWEVLDSGGILFHSLWYGDREEEMSGLRFVHYTEETFGEVVGREYEIVESERYTEMEQNDSIYFILKKRWFDRRQYGPP